MLLQLENDRKLGYSPRGDKLCGYRRVSHAARGPCNYWPFIRTRTTSGRTLQAFAKFPDGTHKSLIHIPGMGLELASGFSLRDTRVELPAGTPLSMRYRYDNSDENIRNPNVPPKREWWEANRASDEMAHLWLQVLPRSDPGDATDPRRILQEAMARHNVEKNPADFEARITISARCCRGAVI